MFLIPMAGLSSRFYQAGYTVPKYQLPLGDRLVFDYVVDSFRAYFDDDLFVFAVRCDLGVVDFLEDRLRHSGIREYRIVQLPGETRGQAETVKIALDTGFADDELFIFNIDTFRPGFRKAAFHRDVAGYLEVFEGEGDHWSFAVPGAGSTVVRTTEKERVSSLCSDGLYHFRSSREFSDIATAQIAQGRTAKGEYYVAPMYNALIAADAPVRYDLIAADKVIFCGTPVEYEACLRDVDRLTQAYA